MKKTISTILILSGLAFQSNGQYLVNQVITVAGGSFGMPDNKVKYSTYNPWSNTFNFFDSIPGNFTNAALAHNSFLYSNASNTIYKHDLGSYQRVDSVSCGGIQKMAWHQNNLIVSRSLSFGASSNNLIVFDLNTLDTVAQIEGFTQPTGAMLVVGDSLYVTWNIPGINDQVPPTYNFDSIGYISVVDLTTLTKVRDIELGNTAGGINSLVIDQATGIIYGGCLVSASLVAYTPLTGVYTITPTQTPTCSKLLTVTDNGELLGTFGTSGVGVWDITNQTILVETQVEGNFISSVVDSIQYNLYATETDYFSFGSLSVFINDTVADSVYQCGISPEAIAIDYVITVGEKQTESTIFSVYPNPAGDFITVESASKISIKDISGKEVYSNGSEKRYKWEIDLSMLKPGAYFIETDKGKRKLIKI